MSGEERQDFRSRGHGERAGVSGGLHHYRKRAFRRGDARGRSLMSDPSFPPRESSANPAPVTDWRRTPLGVVPRHLQQWVLVGVAVVMVGILALSGPPAKPRTTAASSPATMAVDPNQQRIEEYQRRIQEQAQRLAAEQAQLQLTKEAVGASPEARGPARRSSTTHPRRGRVRPRRRTRATTAPGSRTTSPSRGRTRRIWRTLVPRLTRRRSRRRSRPRRPCPRWVRRCPPGSPPFQVRSRPHHPCRR